MTPGGCTPPARNPEGRSRAARAPGLQSSSCLISARDPSSPPALDPQDHPLPCQKDLSFLLSPDLSLGTRPWPGRKSAAAKAGGSIRPTGTAAKARGAQTPLHTPERLPSPGPRAGRCSTQAAAQRCRERLLMATAPTPWALLLKKQRPPGPLPQAQNFWESPVPRMGLDSQH